jgi:hypothetical protein
MVRQSKEYEEFLEEFSNKRHSLYEKLCNAAEKILPLPPPKSISEKYDEAINFCHIDATPKGAFALAVLSVIILSLFFLGVTYASLSMGALNEIDSSIKTHDDCIAKNGVWDATASTCTVTRFLESIVILFSIFIVSIFFYLYTYLQTLSTSYRIKASSEMVLAIVYMTIAMKVIPNIEYAVKFAAKNLTGPLSRDLKQMIWDVYTNKYNSISDCLEPFIDKWKHENEEFTKSIYLIKMAFFESSEKRNRMLNEAVTVVLAGTEERMKSYSRDLKSPITVINALGIMLPIIGLVFFPLMGLFLPDIFRPHFLVLGYNIILPISIYWIMKTYLEKRPATFHQPDLSKHPKFADKKMERFILALCILLPALAVSFFSYKLSTISQKFSFDLIAYSLGITWTVTAAIVAYTLLTTLNKLKIRQEIISIESELGEVLFQLGNQLTRGMPIESALRSTLPKVKELKIHGMFERILYNMETFGMTFTAAVFDRYGGAINYYPSNLISAVMNAVTEISKSGSVLLSDAMLAISTYLKNMNSVEQHLEETMEDVTSTMQMQSLLLAPLSSGIVVAMTAMIVQVIYTLKLAVEKIYGSLSSFGPLGGVGSSLFTSILQIDKIMPIYGFQLIVSIYMIEIVAMITIFLCIIKYGDDQVQRKYTLGKMVLFGTAIYTTIFLLIYFVFVSMMPSWFV